MTLRQPSPAQRHQARILAMKASGQSEPGTVTTGSQYELMLYKLAEDRRRLKQIQSIQSKIALKAQLLPDYQAWIDGALAGGKGAQDDVLTTVLVWSIDAGEYNRALQIAGYVVQHKMTLPDQYERDIPTMLLDEFSSAYFHGKLADDPVSGVRILSEVNALTQTHDAPDQARAKLYKALAYAQIAVTKSGQADDKAALSESELETARAALANLTKALGLYEGVGVKKDIDQLERRIKKSDTP